jgi:nicotinamide-nucleotide amidase
MTVYNRFKQCIDPMLIARAAEVVGQLQSKSAKVVTAESCTAGLLATALSHADGASDVLEGGFVTYSKEQKSLALGVNPVLLREKGSVNTEVARQMAEGALRRSAADISVSITGVLGPSKDEDGNPVGLIYIGSAMRGGDILVQKYACAELSVDQLRRWVVLECFDCILNNTALLRSKTAP